MVSRFDGADLVCCNAVTTFLWKKQNVRKAPANAECPNRHRSRSSPDTYRHYSVYFHYVIGLFVSPSENFTYKTAVGISVKYDIRNLNQIRIGQT